MNPYRDVRPGGYAWWYFDAVSDDGARALTAIFFIGSVFSPDYAARVRKGERPRAEEHLAVNLALYDRGRQRTWVMSEYGAAALGPVGDAGPRIADSAIERRPDGSLRLTVRERTAPFFVSLARVGAPVVGTIDVEPHAPPLAPVDLVATGERHRWHVMVPRAHVRVRFSRPAFTFDGVGYHDVNAGDGRLEDAFANWSWARFHDAARTTILYVTTTQKGATRALLVDAPDDQPAAERSVQLLPEGERARAPWGLVVPRWLAVDDGGRTLRVRARQMLESAPFYARYAATLEAPAGGDVRRVTGVGEYLDLDRFRRKDVQFLLRFKTRRT